MELEIILTVIVAMTAVIPIPAHGQHACQDITRINECIGIIEGTTGQELDPSVEPPTETGAQQNTTGILPSKPISPTETAAQQNTTRILPSKPMSSSSQAAIIVGGEQETKRAVDILLGMGFSVKLQPLSQIQPQPQTSMQGLQSDTQFQSEITGNQSQNPLGQLGEALGGLMAGQ